MHADNAYRWDDMLSGTASEKPGWWGWQRVWKKIAHELIVVETGRRSMEVHYTTHLLFYVLSWFYSENMAVLLNWSLGGRCPLAQSPPSHALRHGDILWGTTRMKLPESRDLCYFLFLKNPQSLEQCLACRRSSVFCGIDVCFSTWVVLG